MSLTPVSESLELVPLQVVDKCKLDYQSIEEALVLKDVYCPIFANEFAPEDRFQRKN